MKYTDHVVTAKNAKQDEKLNDSQVKNSSGAYVFTVTPQQRLERFLVLGSEGGSYYASEKKLTRENASNIVALIKQDGKAVVDTVVSFVESNRLPKIDPALFVLALVNAQGDDESRSYAIANLNRVAKTGTHIMQFVSMAKDLRGLGRSLKRGIANWYQQKSVDDVVYQVIKYQNRAGYSNRDLLRLSHPKTEDNVRNLVYRFVTKPDNSEEIIAELKKVAPDNFRVKQLIASKEIHKMDKKDAIKIIKELKLPREVVPTELLNEVKTWEALIPDMPVNAMVRNLAKMTNVGLITPLGSHTKHIVETLTNADAIKKSRIHPLAIASALYTYSQGHGERGKLSWSPNSQIIDALNDALYISFGNVEPTNKRIMLALDVSGSMGSPNIAGVPGISPKVGSGIMAMVTARVESQYFAMGFSSGFIPLNITKKQRLDDVIRTISGLPFDSTNCSVPMQYAEKNNIPVDAFVVYTDSETNSYRSDQPVVALNRYRQKTGIAAKLIVVGMTASSFTIADPNDAGMLDVIGFDLASPNIISDFIKG